MNRFDFAPFELFKFKALEGADCICEIAIAEIVTGGISVTMREIEENPGPSLQYVPEYAATALWLERLRKRNPEHIRWFIFSMSDGLQEIRFNQWPTVAAGGVFDAPQALQMNIAQMYTVH